MMCFCSEGQYIIAGSDDGSVYFWDRKTTNNVRILRGDSSIVNCLQPHPSYCLLATSGIDPLVRLWSPRPEVWTLIPSLISFPSIRVCLCLPSSSLITALCSGFYLNYHTNFLIWVVHQHSIWDLYYSFLITTFMFLKLK